MYFFFLFPDIDVAREPDLQSSGLDSCIHSGTTTSGPGSISGFGFDPKMEIPVAANTSGDLYDINRAGYDQGYTQQEVEGKQILYIFKLG